MEEPKVEWMKRVENDLGVIDARDEWRKMEKDSWNTSGWEDEESSRLGIRSRLIPENMEESATREPT